MRIKFIAIDLPLMCLVLMLCGVSLIVLYSAGGENIDLVTKQAFRMTFALTLMLVFSQISTAFLFKSSPYVYLVGVALLVIVLMYGIVGKGAQRWIDFSVIRFQPAEIMKIAVPMMVAWILTQFSLPLRPVSLLLSVVVVGIPCFLIIQQPDLGTALLVALAGLMIIFLAGISWKLIVAVAFIVTAALPVLWAFVLHDYQRSRVLTLFDPWADPLGAGYHTIQSIIAIGSGGGFGKGWLSGSQSQLEFIPERNTDFIFAVFAEEFGLFGFIILMALYLFAIFRGLFIAFYANTTYARLLAGGISATFLFYIFVNIGMVSGILPVVGVPLPLISYGGTSMVTLMIGFGILMRISNEKNARMR